MKPEKSNKNTEKSYKIFISQKVRSLSDDAVTACYIKTLCDGFLSAGVQVFTEGTDQCQKSDFVLVDTVFDALRTYIHGKRKIVFWAQGILPEESYLRHRSWIRSWILSALERFVLKKSKILFLVSKEMLFHYERKYHMNLSEKTFIMPCFHETSLNMDAFQYPLKYDFQTFAYVGSLNAWQCFEKTAALYKKIEVESEEQTKLFVFTFQTEEAKEIIERYQIQNYEIAYVLSDALSSHLCKIKYGFVLREDIAVNRVATPTKFSSYLSNGVIPIYSSVLSDFSGIDPGIGLRYDFEHEDLCYENLRKHMKCKLVANEMMRKCKRIFTDYYDTERYIAAIGMFLKKYL